MHAYSVTLVTAAVTILAILFYFWTGINVGRMRTKHGVNAPTMTGNPEFERAVRVQMNTLEWFVIFVPLLWLATIYFSPAMTMVYLSWLPPIFGLIWIVGRVLYMTGYMVAAEKRSSGFLIAGIAIIGLLICAIVGVVMTWSAVAATVAT
jgi:glutathione S-transferase